MRHYQILRRRAAANTAGRIVLRAMAGTEPAAIILAAEIPRRPQRNAAKMRTDADHHQPLLFALLHACIIGFRIAQGFHLHLARGFDTPTQNDGDWYLRSQANTPTPPTPQMRPEPGVYLANQSLARHLFINTLHDRAGGEAEADAAQHPAWARMVVGEASGQAAQGVLSMQSNTTLLQAGADLIQHTTDTQQLRAGVMGNYAKASTDGQARGLGATASGGLTAYGAGIYATWYGAGVTQDDGVYVDTWAQYGSFRQSVNGNDLPGETLQSHSWSGSLEAGYDYALGAGLHVLPQAQLVYTAYQQPDHLEANGTLVQSAGVSGFSSRLGLRFYGSVPEAGDGRTQPFAEANWWHDFANATLQFDGTPLAQSAPKNRYELKIGVERNVGRAITLWFNGALQVGAQAYSSVQAQVGGKYRW